MLTVPVCALTLDLKCERFTDGKLTRRGNGEVNGEGKRLLNLSNLGGRILDDVYFHDSS